MFSGQIKVKITLIDPKIMDVLVYGVAHSFMSSYK